MRNTNMDLGNIFSKGFLLILSVWMCSMEMAMAQSAATEEQSEALGQSLRLTARGNAQIEEGSFKEAELSYRGAIAKSKANGVAPLNMGNAYYREKSMGEAFLRYQEASEQLESKSDKHRAFHNMGNVFMENKEYQKAVEAYKEALRNNPKDEETRYNLALAKDMLKNNPPPSGGGQDNKDDQQQQQQQQQGQGEKDQEAGADQSDKGEKQEQPQQQQENKPQQSQEPKPGEGGDQQQQKEGLSPQQVRNLLEAMNNEEQKVLEKLKAKKLKGQPKANEKDW